MFGPRIWHFGKMTEPLSEMLRLRGEMNRLFSGMTSPFSEEFPLINVWVGKNDAIVTAELPGIDHEKTDISIVGDILTLTGVRDRETLKEGESYHRQERNYGRFTRTLQLPFHVDTGKIEARYEKGILSMTLPRSEEDKPKKIIIKTA
jgi:HSP20 family protein